MVHPQNFLDGIDVVTINVRHVRRHGQRCVGLFPCIRGEFARECEWGASCASHRIATHLRVVFFGISLVLLRNCCRYNLQRLFMASVLGGDWVDGSGGTLVVQVVCVVVATSGGTIRMKAFGAKHMEMWFELLKLILCHIYYGSFTTQIDHQRQKLK